MCIRDRLTPQVTRHIVDDVLVGGQMGKLKYLLLAILLIGIGRCIFQYTKEFKMCIRDRLISGVKAFRNAIIIAYFHLTDICQKIRVI